MQCDRCPALLKLKLLQESHAFFTSARPLAYPRAGRDVQAQLYLAGCLDAERLARDKTARASAEVVLDIVPERCRITDELHGAVSEGNQSHGLAEAKP